MKTDHTNLYLMSVRITMNKNLLNIHAERLYDRLLRRVAIYM